MGAALGPSVAGQVEGEQKAQKKNRKTDAERVEERVKRAEHKAKAKAAAKAKRAKRDQAKKAKQKPKPETTKKSEKPAEEPSGYLQDLIRRTIKHGPTGKPATREEAKENSRPIKNPGSEESKGMIEQNDEVHSPPLVAESDDTQASMPSLDANSPGTGGPDTNGPDLGFNETPAQDKQAEQSAAMDVLESPSDIAPLPLIDPKPKPKQEILLDPKDNPQSDKPEIIEPNDEKPIDETIPQPNLSEPKVAPMFEAPKVGIGVEGDILVPLDLPLYSDAQPQDAEGEPKPAEEPTEEVRPQPATREAEGANVRHPSFDPPALERPSNQPSLNQPSLKAADPAQQKPASTLWQPPGLESADTPVAYPLLPPDPYADEQTQLAPLQCELHHHGGSYLYQPEGDAFQQHQQEAYCDPDGHHQALRLPEHFQAPQPCTHFAEYLGADPIQLSPHSWDCLPGNTVGSYQWEPRFVAHGRYDVFGIAFEEGNRRQDGIGHNLTLDADLRLTGTERFHFQHRPIGEDGSGGSFYRFDNPQGYVDNSTAEPSRFWFEGEVASIFSGWLNDPTQAWDMNFAIGKFPLGLHNNLLINDEVAGVIVGQNNRQEGTLSNLNTRVFWLWDDVNAFEDIGSEVLGADAFIDYQHAFIEATYAYRKHGRTSDGDAHYLAASATQFFGTNTATARALVKIAGPADTDGQLFVLEWNTHVAFDDSSTWEVLARTGIHHGVAYANAFYATQGWSPISGANFNRIRSSFEVNPLVLIARGDRDDTPGVAAGIQLFGEHEDSSLTPEIAWEAPGGRSIFGTGLRYQRRTSVGSFLELRGLVNFSEDQQLDRDGLFGSHHWLF